MLDLMNMYCYPIFQVTSPYCLFVLSEGRTIAIIASVYSVIAHYHYRSFETIAMSIYNIMLALDESSMSAW